MSEQTTTFQLPLGIVSAVDVGRLLREIEAINTFMRSAETRQPGTSVQPPKTSKLLDEFLEINQKSALKSEDREEIAQFLKTLREDAPTIHMSFSADPSALFTKRLIEWLRQNIHPSLLLRVGLQPTIGAGTVVRTTNKYFDFSLREFFNKQKPLLVSKLHTDETPADSPPATAPANGAEQSEPRTVSSPPAAQPTPVRAEQPSPKPPEPNTPPSQGVHQ